MILFYILIVISIFLLWVKIKNKGLNLLRFNFAVFIMISLIPFSILYNDYFNDINSYYIYKLLFTLIFILIITIDKTKISIKSFSKLDLQFIKIISILSLVIIFIFILLVGVNNFPLFHVLNGSYNELILMREDSYKNANIPQILFYLVFYVKYFFIPFYVSAITIYWKYINHKIAYIILFIMATNQLLTLSKTAFFMMILAFILTKLYLTKITLTKVFMSMAVMSLIPLLILYLIVSDRELLLTLGAIGNRIFLLPEDDALDYYYLYTQGAFNGLTSSKMFALFNHDNVINIQNYVFLKIHPNAMLKQGTSPGNIFGIAYVDFNRYLIPLYHSFILAFIYWLNNLVIKYRNSIVISLLVSASMGLSFIYFTNFPTVINSYGIVFIIIFSILLRSKQLKKYKRIKNQK